MKRVGPYVLIDEIGRGGQATVFLAEDSRLKRKVALKVLNEAAASAHDTLERFRREAELASRLDHPGICPVFEAGVEDGVPFIAMRYIEGESLARRIARAQSRDAGGNASVDLESESLEGISPTPSIAGPPRLSRDELDAAALLVEKVARALHAAHELGVVHRDIKPANIMITPDGEPVLLDLGLARDESADHQTLTRTGDTFGTPAYMSPEQLTGQRIRSDRRTDVYALGATLYEALTLRRPFEAPTREALFQAILTESPRDARRLNPRIPVELKTVIETALEKNRSRRYQTALALAEDLERARKHEPIRAKPPGPLLRLRRWVQRRPATAASITGIVVALGLLGYAIGAAGKASLNSRLRRHAETERDRLEQAEKDEVLQRKMADLETHLGTMLYAGPYILGHSGAIDLRPLCRNYLAAYEAFGLPLSSPGGATESLRVLEEVKLRNPGLWGGISTSLKEFTVALQAAKMIGAGDADLVNARAETASVVSVLAPDPWDQEISNAEADWDKNGNDDFGRFLAPDVLAGRSASDLGRLAGALLPIPERKEQMRELLDRALDLEPDNYGLRVWRGGIALMGVATGDDSGLDQALLDYSIARALRPKSGLACVLMAVSVVYKRDYQRALALVDKATQLEPDSALIWVIAADFYSKSPERGRAVAAARKALELDPTLARATEILQKLEGSATKEQR